MGFNSGFKGLNEKLI